MKIGILGAGQLARMLALSGYPLGMQFIFLDTSPDGCAFPLGEKLVGDFDDLDLIRKFRESADVITYEFENVSAKSIQSLSEKINIYPSFEALETKKDRLLEKKLFEKLDIPTASFTSVNNFSELLEAKEKLGLPLVLKTRSFGYDGKGQLVVRSEKDLQDALEKLGNVPLIAEKFIPFERELSIIGVRGKDGKMVFYPISENVHRNGILHLTKSKINDPMEDLAQKFASTLLKHFDYVGTVAIEFFQFEGKLLVNEYAPRVHNSGHWTIEGAITSQFENHLRAIAGLPLGSASLLAPTAMINCVGRLPNISNLLEIPDLHFHSYGKSPRPGRKIGHITVRGRDEKDLQEKLNLIFSKVDF